MKSRLLIVCFVFFLMSCGGGTSQSNENLINDVISTKESCVSVGLKTERCTFMHNELERFYFIYKPESLSQNNNELPLLFALHGSSAAIHKSYTQYENLA